jgi:signal peptidase I
MPDRRPSPLIRFARDLLVIFAFLGVVQVGAVQAYVVPTGSMEKTILAGELVIADKITLGPRTPQWIGIPWTRMGMRIPALKLPGTRAARRGDIVVVETPADPVIPFVKRVVAIGGDVVEVRDKRLFVNGAVADDSSHIRHDDPRTFPRSISLPGVPPELGSRDNWGPFRVPAGQVFLMGDNRDFSADSRYFGPVREDHIIGRARMVAASFSPSRFWRDPIGALRLGRWGRRLV